MGAGCSDCFSGMQSVRLMTSRHKNNMELMSRITSTEREMDQLNQQQSLVEDQIAELRSKLKPGQRPSRKQNDRMRSLLSSRKALKESYSSKEKHARELRALQRKTDSVYAAHDLRDAKQVVAKELKRHNLIGASAMSAIDASMDADDEAQDIVDAVSVQLDSTVYDEEVDDDDLAAAWACDEETEPAGRALPSVGKRLDSLDSVFAEAAGGTSHTYDMRPREEREAEPLEPVAVDARAYAEEKYGINLA